MQSQEHNEILNEKFKIHGILNIITYHLFT